MKVRAVCRLRTIYCLRKPDDHIPCELHKRLLDIGLSVVRILYGTLTTYSGRPLMSSLLAMLYLHSRPDCSDHEPVSIYLIILRYKIVPCLILIWRRAGPNQRSMRVVKRHRGALELGISVCRVSSSRTAIPKVQIQVVIRPDQVGDGRLILTSTAGKPYF